MEKSQGKSHQNCERFNANSNKTKIINEIVQNAKLCLMGDEVIIKKINTLD